jgi:hypothetical protein
MCGWSDRDGRKVIKGIVAGHWVLSVDESPHVPWLRLFHGAMQMPSTILPIAVPPDTPGAPDFSITNVPPPAPAPATAPTPAAPAASISQMWGRAWSLGVSKPGSGQPVGTGDAPAPGQSATAIDIGHDTQSRTQEGSYVPLTDFHFTFEVTMQQFMTPWTMVARVYNVPPDYLPGLLEYTEVQLVAGYQRPTRHTNPNVVLKNDERGLPMGEDTGAWNMGSNPPSNSPGGSLLFNGQVVFIEHGKENATDTFMELHCASKDDAINNAISNMSLPAGSQAIDIIGRCVVDMNQYNGSPVQITVGQITPTLDPSRSPRGRVLYGPTQAILRDVGQSANGFFHVDQGNQLHLIAAGEMLPNPVITLNSQSGMVDIPHQGLDGSMRVTSLLNPDLRPGRLIQLNERDVTRAELLNFAK